MNEGVNHDISYVHDLTFMEEQSLLGMGIYLGNAEQCTSLLITHIAISALVN